MKIFTLENYNWALDRVEKKIINNESMTDKEKVDELWKFLNNLKRMFYSLAEWRESFR